MLFMKSNPSELCKPEEASSARELPYRHQREKQDQRHIDREELRKEAAGAGVLRVRIELQTDEAGKARDRGAEAADIDAQQKRVGL